jgi:archaellum component FlaC
MDAITKDLLNRRKKEIEWIQGTYKEAIAEAVNILNNEPEGEDTAQRALENIEGLQEEVERIKMLNI